MGLDYLREETKKNPLKDIILYVRSGHADDQMVMCSSKADGAAVGCTVHVVPTEALEQFPQDLHY